MGTYIFLQLFGMACKLFVALNTDMQSVMFRLFNLRYFISPFVFQSLNGSLYQNGTNLTFFSARKFRHRLDSEDEVVTFRS